ncbi:MAG: ribonuclease III [Methylotenera sp.]|nr:ribonuclease III [Methylotenera sp.]MDD4926626.1 ribonuclease III [Methylotenera sp.]NOS94812.1 ribonuclease III [Methylotenera sp.]NOU40644.1 ribonuclease III [Methylotenera sp.]
MMHSDISRRLSYSFVNANLLTQALTHRSYGAQNNERLEFLGDGALNFIIANQLYQRFSKIAEGDLSRLRAQMVKESTLSEIALSLNLGDALKMGEGELKSAGWRRPSILADALEAIIGAVYLDGGFAAAETFVLGLYANKLDAIDPKVIDKDPKSLLQELLQSRKIAVPEYTVTHTSGEAHAQMFVVECFVEKHSIRTVGEGNSRRIAEQQAAQLALLELKKVRIGKN